MKRLLFLICLVAAPAWAQIKLGLKIVPSTAMQYEKVEAEITIQNNTGEPLDSSSNGNCRIVYLMHNQQGDVTRRLPKAVSPLSVLVPPARTQTFRDNVSGQFDVGRPGSYTIQARVERGDYTFTSESRYLDVVPGVEVNSLTATTPDGWRKFSVAFLNRDKHDRLFLRIDDADLCYGVFDLGRLVRMKAPEMKVDAAGLLHVLHQSAPQQFAYSVFTADGRQTVHELLGSKETMVQLVNDADGAVKAEERQVRLQETIRPSEPASTGDAADR